MLATAGPSTVYEMRQPGFPREVWGKPDMNTLADFGSRRVELTIREAAERGLVALDPYYGLFKRTCWTREDEDGLLSLSGECMNDTVSRD